MVAAAALAAAVVGDIAEIWGRDGGDMAVAAVAAVAAAAAAAAAAASSVATWLGLGLGLGIGLGLGLGLGLRSLPWPRRSMGQPCALTRSARPPG